MIISASYKTDIPAFYGEWFINRLNAGYCKMVNPYNHHAYRVSLERSEVEGFIFWTKNIRPFMDSLMILSQRGYPFFVQHTINGYPRSLESSVVDAKRSVEHLKMLSGQYGAKSVVWRYDTVLFSSLTPIDFHLQNFERLAKELAGTTDEVVISFAQIYKKTLRNMNLAARKKGFTWYDPEPEVKYNLAAELAQIAKSYGMQLTMCSQRQFLAPGVEEARCIDARRLSAISGQPIFAKLRGNRVDCGCYEGRDIGEYDTCPHGCVYCYAVQDHALAARRYKEHDPLGEFLFAPQDIVVDKTQQNDDDASQMTLF